MKWLSLLTVSLMSLCALGSAQEQTTKPTRVRTSSISTQFTPTSQVNLSVGQALPLDAVLTVTKKYFTISKDGTMIQIKKSGMYIYNFNLLLSTTDLSLATSLINVEVSPDGVTNWEVVNQVPVTPNSFFRGPGLSLNMASSGFIRLTVSSIGTTDLFLSAGTVDVTMTITRNKFVM